MHIGIKAYKDFHVHDSDSSGKLNFDEVKKILGGIGIQVGDGVDIEQLMKEWDVNGDGDVSQKEFMMCIKSFSETVGKILVAKNKLLIATSTFLYGTCLEQLHFGISRMTGISASLSTIVWYIYHLLSIMPCFKLSF